MRDHNPIVIEDFNGLWVRGGEDSCPPDHFTDCNNIAYIQSGFRTRDGLETVLPNNLGLGGIVRIYTFVQQTLQSLLVLDQYGDLYDIQGTTVLGPILSIPTMTDFGFVAFNGRAYITPCNGVNGLSGEFVYVYKGAGVVARRAAGIAPKLADGALNVANSAVAGDVELGIHIFAAVYETDTGFLTSIGPTPLNYVNAPGGKKVDLTNIPVSPNAYVTKVHIVSTIAIDPTLFVGDTNMSEFFFIPGAVVNNGVTTLTVSFFDSELLESADDLQDLYESIPATVGLSSYHGRMIAYATAADISLCLVSNAGQPEAFNQVDGLLIFPLDGKPITNGQEFRDVLYLFKQTKTRAWVDNNDVPSSWPDTMVDQGTGAPLHGIATVLDSGGVNVDFLIIADYSGVILFSGAYIRPELTWKIKDFWMALDRSLFKLVEIKNDSLTQILYVVLSDHRMLIGDYSNGMDAKKIRWAKWSFDCQVNTIALFNTNTLLIGSNGVLV